MAGYPALVDRALRLVELRGAVSESELCQELFGASGGPWGRMLGQVLQADGRLHRRNDGVWTSARVLGETRGPFAVAVAEGPSSAGSLSRERGSSNGVDAPTGGSGPAVVGLVVLGAGPKPWKHPIVAIGAARAGARFETLVRPELPCRVPKYLERLGVRAEELDEAPGLGEALGRLVELVGDARLVGLDVGVAVARLQFALRSVGRAPLDNPVTELAVGEGTKPDLAALARARGLAVPARLSVGAMAELALKLAEGAGGERADGTALGTTAWRRLLDAGALASIPEAPGVYLFRDRGGRLLYVGKATSLRARLASYLTGQFALVRSMPGLVEATARLEHEETECELAARAREAELIAQLKPTYNVQRRLEPALAWAALALDGEAGAAGATVPRLALRLAGEPFEGAVLATVAAARAGFRRARAGWWPARPRREARPTGEEVRERVARLAGQLAHELRASPVAPGLVAADLVGGVRVEAPVRPIRATALTEPEEAGWARERFDRGWPPREVLDFADDEARAVPSLGPPAGGADSAETSVEVFVAPERLAALSVVLAALRRGEAGVRVVRE